MDLIVLTALKRCEETLKEAVRVELTMAGWETVQFDEDGILEVGGKSHAEGEGPVWSGEAGTHPLLPLLQQAIECCEGKPAAVSSD